MDVSGATGLVELQKLLAQFLVPGQIFYSSKAVSFASLSSVPQHYLILSFAVQSCKIEQQSK